MPVPTEHDQLLEIVTSDVGAALGSAFTGGGLTIPEPFDSLVPIGDDRVAVVPWRWTGTHTGEFHQVRPTGFPVDVTGTTFLLVDEADELRAVRFVDWQSLYRQLGLAMVCRRPQTPDTIDVDDVDRPRLSPSP